MQALQRKPETERTEDCAICQKTGCLTADGWYTDATLERDEDGYYMAGHGEYLGEAVETPQGWVCGKRCRSQAMYQGAGKFDQATLRKVHDACRVIAEYGAGAIRVLEAGMEESPTWLVDQATEFLEAVHDDGNDMPVWCNRPMPEEAVRSARHAMENLRDRMGIEVESMAEWGLYPRNYEWMSAHAARNVVTASRITESLQAVNE
jgi:hypothetical protein